MFHNKLVISFKILYYVMKLALKLLSTFIQYRGNVYFSFFPLLSYRFRDYYFVSSIGSQHDRHLRIQFQHNKFNKGRQPEGHPSGCLPLLNLLC